MRNIVNRLEKQVEERTIELKQRYSEHYKSNQETNKILKYVQEGIFILDDKLIIGPQYSTILVKILEEKKIGGKNFVDMIRTKIDEKLIASIEDFLFLMFKNEIDEEIILDLNPLGNVRFQFNNNTESIEDVKFLSFKFRRINYRNGTTELLGTVIDITEKVKLTENLEISTAEAKLQLEWLFNILHIDPMVIKDFITGVQMEMDYIKEVLRENETEDDFNTILEKIFRSIRMIKENASMIDLDIIVRKSHQIEKNIAEIQEKNRIEGSDFIPLILTLDEMKSTLAGIAGLIEKISEIHHNFRPKRSYESDMFIKSLSNFIKALSNDLNKKVIFHYDGFDISNIPYQHRLAIKDILVQLIRDSLYYRIEDREERLMVNKLEEGNIVISSAVNNNSYIIKFRDDGKGIETERLQKKSVGSNKWNGNETKEWGKSEYMDAILDFGFSDEDENKTRAGTIGMNAVKKRIEKLKGGIEVDFQEGKFCEFTIKIPLPRKNNFAESIPVKTEILN